MAKMNYNRPNGGYEQEPWRKSYDSTQAYNKLPKTFPQHIGHKIVLLKTKKPSAVHAGAYRCDTCNKHLAWASKDEIKDKKQTQTYTTLRHTIYKPNR